VQQRVHFANQKSEENNLETIIFIVSECVLLTCGSVHLLNGVAVDWCTTIVSWRVPLQFAALVCDVLDLQWPSWWAGLV
jgi:hypothetical protein